MKMAPRQQKLSLLLLGCGFALVFLSSALAMFDPRGENQPRDDLDPDAIERVEEFFHVNTATLSTIENGPDEAEVARIHEEEEAVEGPFAPPKPNKKTKACWKDGEARGKGQWPDRETRQCPANQEKSMGMCYPRCGEKRNGFGPLCLDDCAKTIYRSNGLLFCCDTEEICKDLVQTLVSKLPKSLIRFLIDVATNPNNAPRIMRDFREVAQNAMHLRLPLCSKINTMEELTIKEDAAMLGDEQQPFGETFAVAA